METNGAVQAQNNVTLTSTAGAIATNDTVTAVTGNIEAKAKGNVTTNDKLSAAQGTISLTSDTENIAVKAEAIAQDDVTLKAEEGSIAVDGSVTSYQHRGYDYYRCSCNGGRQCKYGSQGQCDDWRCSTGAEQCNAYEHGRCGNYQ